MSDFHDIRFPFPVSLGAVGGPERRTVIHALASGREHRNTSSANSRRRWDAGPGIQHADEIAGLVAFFEARRGRLHGFRFHDPLDHKSCLPSRPPAATDQEIGTGDGVQTRFQLVKHYVSGAQSWTRIITKPVPESVSVAVDGEIVDAGTDALTGQVTLTEPPAPGAVVTAGFEFDCAVRFDTDQLDIALDRVQAGQAPSIPLIELVP